MIYSGQWIINYCKYMKKLSKREWIAVAIAVVFVGYTLFSGDIMSLLQKNSTSGNSVAAVNSEFPVTSTGGVDIKDIVVGQGAEVKIGDLVSVNYILSLSDINRQGFVKVFHWLVFSFISLVSWLAS